MQKILSDLLRPVTLRDSMATFYLDAAFISACRGGSAVRAAAYRHAVRMVSHAFTETTSFTHKAQAMVHAEVALPEDAPEWAENAFGHAAFADALRLVRADVQAQGLGYVRSGDAAGRHGAGIRAALERGRAWRTSG